MASAMSALASSRDQDFERHFVTKQLVFDLAPRASRGRIVVVGRQTTVELFSKIVGERNRLRDFEETIPNRFNELQALICWQLKEFGQIFHRLKCIKARNVGAAGANERNSRRTEHA